MTCSRAGRVGGKTKSMLIGWTGSTGTAGTTGRHWWSSGEVVVLFKRGQVCSSVLTGSDAERESSDLRNKRQREFGFAPSTVVRRWILNTASSSKNLASVP